MDVGLLPDGVTTRSVEAHARVPNRDITSVGSSLSDNDLTFYLFICSVLLGNEGVPYRMSSPILSLTSP